MTQKQGLARQTPNTPRRTCRRDADTATTAAAAMAAAAIPSAIRCRLGPEPGALLSLVTALEPPPAPPELPDPEVDPPDVDPPDVDPPDVDPPEVAGFEGG